MNIAIPAHEDNMKVTTQNCTFLCFVTTNDQPRPRIIPMTLFGRVTVNFVTVNFVTVKMVLVSL